MHLFIIAVFVLFASFSAPVAHADCIMGEPGCDPLPTQPGGPAINPVQPGGPNTGNQSTNVTLINPLQGGGNLQSFLLNILDFVIYIGTIIVILMMVFVGYKFVAAQGEPGKITEARSALLWTVVGALILLGSKAIALGIEATVQALSGA